MSPRFIAVPNYDGTETRYVNVDRIAYFGSYQSRKYIDGAAVYVTEPGKCEVMFDGGEDGSAVYGCSPEALALVIGIDDEVES